MIRYLVLGFLIDGEPRHGYALLKEWRSRLRVTLNSGSFYRELRLLCKGGLIAVSDAVAPEDARRTSYVITALGKRAFSSWLLSPLPNLHDNEDELAARAQFLDRSERSRDARLVNEWQDRLWLEGKLLERERDEIRQRSEDRSDGGIVGLLLTRRIARVAADLEFLSSLRRWIETTASSGTAAASSASVTRHDDGEEATVDDRVRTAFDRR